MRRPFEKRDDDRRGKRECSWFVAIEKRAVLSEVRTFGDPLLDKSRCLPIIKKLLYLLNQGETFTKSEAALVLSSAIKLYRFQDIHLRRMFYLIAKELCPVADEVALVTSSLMKDINSNIVIYRVNAIRLLCRITNGASSTQIGKWLTEAYADKNPMVQTAALVCAIHLIKRDPWMAYLLNSYKIGQLILIQAKYMQFHALYLFFWICRDDISRVERLFSKYIKCVDNAAGSFWCSSPLSLCFLARIISQITRVRHVSAVHHPVYYEYLKICIYHKDKMVAIEGFRSVEELRDISISELKPAIDVIRRFLRASPNRVLPFAAFRALQKVGVAHRVVWETPEDYIAIDLDANIKKLYLERDKLYHRDKEAPAEITRVVKSAMKDKEGSTHDLRRRLV